MHLLLDCDGTLVDSETIAFKECTSVLNNFMKQKGRVSTFDPCELQRRFVGVAFPEILMKLSQEIGLTLGEAELDRWTAKECASVTEALSSDVRLCEGVSETLRSLAGPEVLLSVVSSSAAPRIHACMRSTGLDALIPPTRVFSAMSSLTVPESKPSPAVYTHALSVLGATPEDAIAVEDSVNGVKSAVGAGIRTLGYVGSLPLAEREQADEKLHGAGAFLVVDHWDKVPTAIV